VGEAVKAQDLAQKKVRPLRGRRGPVVRSLADPPATLMLAAYAESGQALSSRAGD
jgi:hypothetical protein